MGVSSYEQSAETSEPVLYEVDPASGVSVPHTMDPSIAQARPVSIRAIEQDKAGRLWLGTSIGLVRFDPVGNSFRHYSHTHAPGSRPSRNSGELAWDRSGHLWVRMTNGIERFNPETETFDRFIATGLGRMTADPNGRIWLWGAAAGLAVFDPSSPAETALKSVHYRDSGSPLPEVHIPMLGSDRQGRIWAFLLPDYTLHRFSANTVKFGKHVAELNGIDALRGGMVASFAEAKNGSVWVATNFGLSLFDPLTGSPTSVMGHANGTAFPPTTSLRLTKTVRTPCG